MLIYHIFHSVQMKPVEALISIATIQRAYLPIYCQLSRPREILLYEHGPYRRV